MSRLVHIQTSVQTTFGLLDDDGNVIPQQPVTVTVQKFDKQSFAEAFGVVEKARDEALAAFEDEKAD